MEQHLVKLKNEIPGRNEQISILANILFRQKDSVPSVFLYGAASTGKTFTIKKLLDTFLAGDKKSNCAYVDLMKVQVSARCLFEHALDCWTDTRPSAGDNFTTFARCDTVCDFVAHIGEIFDGSEQKFLVVDHAERLNALGGNLLPVLLDLSSISRRPVTVILVSKLPLDKFRLGSGYATPFSVLFPEYTAQQVLDILALDAPPECESTFRDFSNVIYDIFYKPCRDLSEIRHMTSLLWPKYIQPVVQKLVEPHETAKLVRRMETHFRFALGQLHLRELSRIDWLQRVMNNLSQNEAQKALVQQKTASSDAFELPYFSKWLMIAAYLASYNPAKYDVRYFTKQAEQRAKGKGGKARRSKAMQGAEASSKLKQQLLGPKAFPIERMLAIYNQLVDTFVESDKLSPLDLQIQISQQVHFDIVKYLYDFS